MREAPPQTYGELPPDAALSLVGNDVRAAILLTLSEVRGGRGSPSILSFSELRELVSIDVESSRFNYHLQQLLGTFIERVEPTDAGDDAQVVSEMANVSKEGFRLRPEGTTFIRTIRTWTNDGEITIAPFEMDLGCYFCGTPLVAQYDHALFAVQCPQCSYLYDYNLTPPGVLASDEGEILDRAAAYNRHQRLAFARGSCPFCGNHVDTEFKDPAETHYPRGDLRSAVIRRGCDHCGNKDNLTVGEALLGTADLIEFCSRHGLDLTTIPIWNLEFAATDRHVSVRSTDPWEVSLSVTVDSEELELVIDECLDVVERNRAEA